VNRVRRREGGQAMVEFALAGFILVVVIMAFIDLGLAVYRYNGVAEAAREIARTTSIYPGTPLGSSAETASTIAVQQGIVPGLLAPSFGCVDDGGATVIGGGAAGCAPGDVVQVTVHAWYQPTTPLLTLLGPFDLSSSASNHVQ
jgi:hypothetical protein